jgi:hypothetical protein
MTEENSLSRRYLATIAAAAVVIIAGGVMVRQKLIAPDAPKTTPPSEAFALQRLAQEGQLEEIAAYIDDRVKAVAPFVVRIDGGASGIRWTRPDSVISTSATRPVVLIPIAASDTSRALMPAIADSLGADWLLLVARDGENRVVSAEGIAGGRTTMRCGPRTIEKLVIGFSIMPEFAGAGVFDLGGHLRGMVVSCSDSAYAAVPVTEIARLLSDTLVVTDSLAGNLQARDSGSKRGAVKPARSTGRNR